MKAKKKQKKLLQKLMRADEKDGLYGLMGFIAKITDEGVFVSLEPKPDMADQQFWMGLTDIPHNPLDYPTYQEALKEWEDNLLRVENATEGNEEGKKNEQWVNVPVDGYSPKVYHLLKPSQQVEIELTKEGCKITKI